MPDRFSNPIDLPEQSVSPSAPSSGYHKIYPKADGKIYSQNSAGVEYDLTASGGTQIQTITFGVYNSDGVTPITTGGKISTKIQSPYTGTIIGWSINSDVSTTAIVDIWKDTTNPTNVNSITASAKPTLTAQTKNDSTTLTGWTTSIAAGDLLQIEIESNNNATDIKLILRIQI